MNKEIIIQKTNELLSGFCCPELNAAANEWLKAVDTDNEAAASENYLAELKDGIVPVEGMIEFLGSEEAISKFGADIAAKFLAHGIELKAAGATNCDCPACTKAQEIIEAFEA